MWPPIEAIYRWIERAAALLRNEHELGASQLRRKYAGLLGALARLRRRLGRLGPAADHFLKITRSYWPNLFCCYEIAGLPPTNNGLEQAFGSFRLAQRRATGRKSASRSEVVSGPAKIAACLYTRLSPVTAQELSRVDVAQWKALRSRLGERRKQRAAGRRFRKDPKAYLDNLAERTLKSVLLA